MTALGISPGGRGGHAHRPVLPFQSCHQGLLCPFGHFAWLFPFRRVVLVGWFAFKQEEMAVELYCNFSKRRDDEKMRINRRLMDRASQLWWPGSAKAGAAWHYLPRRGLDWGRTGSGMTELLWWNSLSQWLSLGLVLDDCSCIVWNLSDRTDDGASPCCNCLEDIKWVNGSCLQ